MFFGFLGMGGGQSQKTSGKRRLGKSARTNLALERLEDRTSPTVAQLGSTFDGIPFTGSRPPDPTAAAGPANVLAMVNSRLSLFSKSGTLIETADLDEPSGGNAGFYGALDSDFGSFDPYVIYDTYASRYVAIAEEVEFGGGIRGGPGADEAYLLIGVATSSTPNDLDVAPGDVDDDWHIYKIPAVHDFGGGLAWIDYPKVASDVDGFFITGNYFRFGDRLFQGSKVIRLEKSPMLSGTLGSRTDAVATGGSSLFPAQSIGRSAGDPQLFAERLSTGVRIWEMDDTGPLEVATTLSAANTTHSGGAPQPGTTNTLDTLSPRILSAIWRNNALWATHTVSVGGEATVRWYQISTAGGGYSLTQQGNIDPGVGIHTFMPALAVNSAGSMGITYTQSSSSQFATMMVAGRMATDAAGTTTPGQIVRASTVAYNPSADTIERWGDYSGITVDAADDATFWAFHEYVVSSSAWGTQWGSFTVGPDAPHFVVNAPSSTTAGVAFNITVTALDAFNNTVTGYSGTVHFTSTDGQATLPSDSTLTSGTGTFSVTLKTAGSRIVTATDTVISLTTGASNPITVNAAAASHFTMSAPPGASAGVGFNFTVTARDPFNNTAPNYSGTVHFTSTDGAATLPADATLVGGARTFSASLITLGNQALTATDSVSSSITGTSGTIIVGPGPATHFALSAPSTVTAGIAFVFAVLALDQFENTATTYAGIVHFASSASQANLPIDVTLGNGIGVFAAALNTAGSQTITAADSVSSGISGASTIGVNAGAATHFQLGAPSATAGVAFNLTVTARDAFENQVVGYAGTVHFLSTDGTALLPGDGTLTGGVGTFSAVLKAAGTQAVTATDTATATISGIVSVSVAASAATHFAVSGLGNTTAGNIYVFNVAARDQFNNLAVGYAGIVQFSSSDIQASLPGPGPLTNGVGMFAATLNTAGPRTITAVDSTVSTVLGTSNPIAVSESTIHHFTISAPVSGLTGISFGFTVTARDAFNNFVPSYNGTVFFNSTDADAILPPPTPITGGGGAFTATLKTSGNQTITATDLASVSITGTSPAIAMRGLVVTGLTPTPTGFIAAFNRAFDPAPLNLYDALGVWGVGDVLLVNNAAPTSAIRGSLILNSTNTGFTFIRTGTGTAGVLTAGTYTATIRSATDGFKDTWGGLLDGNNDGIAGDNLTAFFTVATTPASVLSIPDFARGPDGATNIKVPNNSSAGQFIPVTLTGASNVTDVAFNLTYNPAYLTISAASNGTSGTFTLISNVGGVASFSFHSSAGLSGVLTLGHIIAQVPNAAATSYKAMELLTLSNISSVGSSPTPMANNAVHEVAYFADVSGDGSISGADGSQIARVASGLDSGAPGTGLIGGFEAYPLLDPPIIGDLNQGGAGPVDGTDVTLINSYLAGVPRPQIPQIPTGSDAPDPGIGGQGSGDWEQPDAGIVVDWVFGELGADDGGFSPQRHKVHKEQELHQGIGFDWSWIN